MDSPEKEKDIKGLLGSTFISSVGHEDSTDTKVNDEREDQQDLVQMDYEMSKDEASNQMNSFTDIINSISFNKSIDSALNNSNVAKEIQNISKQSIENSETNKFMNFNFDK